jgi:hypothetical protein
LIAYLDAHLRLTLQDALDALQVHCSRALAIGGGQFHIL